MTRIIAGRAGGRRIRVPGSGTRPTSDRVRESMFASIESRLLAEGRTWSDVAVCDLWAGSGALALEAWSRGVRRALAVDKSKAAVETIASNISELGAQGVRVERADISTLVRRPPIDGAFDLVLADPPYDTDDDSIRRDLSAGLEAGWWREDAVFVIERRTGAASPFPPGIESIDDRRYGDSTLWYGRVVDGREERPL